MGTLVFRSSVGPLIQTQIGAADLVATIHAAHSLYGWLGGLDSVRFLVNAISHKFKPGSMKLQNVPLEHGLKLLPTRVHVLTSVGPQALSINDAESCFGNDPRTQLMGLSICALAHEMGGIAAARIFTRHLLPRLFDAPPELLHSIEVQLSDRQILTKILNEGASRGLTESFLGAIASSGIPPGNWRSTQHEIYDADAGVELNFVRGLITWIAEDSSNPYFTRSGLAARVAVCLQTVGYMIGRVEAWDGSEKPPIGLELNAVVLVLGGSYPTDPLYKPSDEMEKELHPFDQIHYYTDKTIGSLIYNAFDGRSHVSPERLQEDFEHIRRYIVSNAEVKWLNLVRSVRAGPGIKKPYLGVGCIWRETPESSSIERALAGIFFPNACDVLAPCYRRIASDDMLQGARKSKNENMNVFAENNDCEYANELILFRATTACIVIALTSYLALDTFTTVQHQTLLHLSEQDWLDQVCPGLDCFASSNITFTSAVYQLAAIHTGYNTENLFEFNRLNDCSARIIGCRSGAFSVLPKLLLKMEPTVDSIGLSCCDRFFANLFASEDGTMEDTQTPRAYLGKRGMHQDTGIDDQHQSTALPVDMNKPWMGPSHAYPPDRPLYLSLERHSFSKLNEVGLVARIDGEVVGETGILDILWTLLRSSHVPVSCDHPDSMLVWNLRASHWTIDRLVKPAGTKEIPAYLQIQGHNCWALLIAGESMYRNSYMVSRCINCAHELLQSSKPSGMFMDMQAGILIGYESSKATKGKAGASRT